MPDDSATEAHPGSYRSHPTATMSSTEVQDLLVTQMNTISKLREELDCAKRVMDGEMERQAQLFEEWDEKARIQMPRTPPPKKTSAKTRSPLCTQGARGDRGSWRSTGSCCLSTASSWEEIDADEPQALITPGGDE